MTILYASATDHINKHIYYVTVPGYYQDVHRETETGQLFAPVYEPFDSRAEQRAAITIARMVDLMIGRVPFTILDDKDVVQILHHIDAYVEEVFALRGDARITSYITKIIELRGFIYKLFRRVLNLHVEWKKAYSGNQGVFEIIQALYAPFGIPTDIPAGLLDALVICPTLRLHAEHERHITQTTPPSLQEEVRYGV